MDEAKSEWAGIFSRASSTYDQVGPRVFTHFGQGLVDFANIPEGAHVLDIASGKGALLFPAADAVGTQGKVIGIDIAEGMVKATANAITERQLPHAEIRQMDAENLAFPDETFDVVVCGFAVFFFPNPHQAFAEIHRVLKPAGKFVFSTFDKQNDDEWQWFSDIARAHISPEPVPKPAPEPTHPAQPMPEFDTSEGLHTFLKETGFANVQVAPRTTEFVYATSEEYWSTLWSHGMRRALEYIERTSGTDGLERFKSDVTDKFNALKQDDGFHGTHRVLFTSAIKT